MRVEVTMKREGMKTSTLVSGGSALPAGCRAVEAGGQTLLTLCPPLRLQDSHGGPRHRDSPALVLCRMVDKAVDGIKLPLIKYLLSHCTQHPNSSPAPARTGAVQPAMCVGRPWPPHPSSCRNPRQPQGCQPCLGDPGDGTGRATSPKPPPDSNQGFRKERRPSQKAKYIFCLLSASNAHLWSCAGCPPCTHSCLSPQQDRTWQRHQLLPEPLQVSLSAMNKSCFSSPAPFLAELMACAPLGTQALAKTGWEGRSKGGN